jgi:hypothetical protein
MVVTEWRQDKKHQIVPGRQRIRFGLFCAALIPGGRQIISQLFAMKVPIFRHSTSAEAAAAAADVSH